MKVGIIAPYSNTCPPQSYGGESYYFGLADTLGKMGHEVHLFAPEGSLVPTDGFLHIIPGPTKGIINYAIEVEVEKKYHDLLMGMDIVHDCSLDHIAAERLRHLYGKREIINTINGRCYNMPRPAFNVVTGSKAWQQDARVHGLNTEMIHWAIDTEFYTPGDKESTRGNWYLWIARFHPDKGLDVALDLAEELGFELKVAGSMEFSDHKMYGEKYLERINRLPNVEYIGLPLDNNHHIAKRDLYRSAKAFLYPVQYFECFGMVVVESMACGCPVITTGNGAMPELVVDRETGFICNNAEDFITVLKDTMPYCSSPLTSNWKCNLWGNSVKQAKKFSWKRAAAEYENLYLEVLHGEEW